MDGMRIVMIGTRAPFSKLKFLKDVAGSAAGTSNRRREYGGFDAAISIAAYSW
jgi:hypothetical protein